MTGRNMLRIPPIMAAAILAVILGYVCLRRPEAARPKPVPLTGEQVTHAERAAPLRAMTTQSVATPDDTNRSSAEPAPLAPPETRAEAGPAAREETEPAQPAAPPHAPAADTDPHSTPETDDLLARFRAERNPIVRREMMRKWADDRLPSVAAVADFAVDDSDPTVIIQSAQIIGTLRRRASAALLLRVLEANRSRPDGYGPAVCEAVVQALGECGDPSAVPVLIKDLTSQHDLSYYNAVARALGQIGDSSAAESVDRHIERLQSRRPTEPIALGPWQEAMSIALEAQARLRKLK